MPQTVGRNIFAIFGKRAFSLKTKITILVVFLITAILLSIGYLQIARDERIRYQEMTRRAQTVAKTMLSFNILADNRRPNYPAIQRYLRRFLSQEDLAEDIVFITFLDRNGRILTGSLNTRIVSSYKVSRNVDGREVIEEFPIETREEEIEFIDKLLLNRVVEMGDNLLMITTDLGKENREEIQAITIGFSKSQLKSEIVQAYVINLSIFAVYMVIGILASIFLGSAISKPIKVLEEAMKRVSAGDLNQRLEISTRDEIGTLAATFNYMTEGLREKEKIKREFLIAREVQMNMLPREIPEHPRLEFASYFEPATEVGGDFYDYLVLGKEEFGIVIGDVSGHGMSAGLLMAITKSCLHTQLSYEPELNLMMASMNNILFDLSEPRTMVTMFFAVLDAKNSRLSFTNAGHPFTYLISENGKKIIALESISYPLAVKKGLTFTTKSVDLAPGDFLVFYSDGIIEALDESGQMFGFEHLEEILSRQQFSSAHDLLDTIISEVRIHSGTMEQYDDMTAVIIQFKA